MPFDLFTENFTSQDKVDNKVFLTSTFSELKTSLFSFSAANLVELSQLEIEVGQALLFFLVLMGCELTLPNVMMWVMSMIICYSVM